MALAYNFEEITPRELKPALYELDGISRETVEAHYKLYQGYVNKRNEILGKLADVDLASANQVYSEFRSLKVDLSFAVGGIKNHEIYFEHLGGHGGEVLEVDLVVDRKSTRLNSSHQIISYAVFCLKKKKNKTSQLSESRSVFVSVMCEAS